MRLRWALIERNSEGIPIIMIISYATFTAFQKLQVYEFSSSTWKSSDAKAKRVANKSTFLFFLSFLCTLPLSLSAHLPFFPFYLPLALISNSNTWTRLKVLILYLSCCSSAIHSGVEWIWHTTSGYGLSFFSFLNLFELPTLLFLLLLFLLSDNFLMNLEKDSFCLALDNSLSTSIKID